MTKEELIAKQQIEIEEYKEKLKENSDLIQKLKMRFYAIGAPLNDNVLKFNKEQMLWAFKTVELIEQLNGI